MAETAILAPDAVDGWPTPEAQPAWYGAPEAEATLRAAYAAGRMHHAWLLGGPRGIGKATLAFRLARFILDHPDPQNLGPGESLAVDADHRTFRQIVAGAHPNLLHLRRPFDDKTGRYRTDLTVSEVRRIQHFFGSTPGEAGWRIAIVDTADELNISAGNALLKMLEEPPSRSLFLLVSNTPGLLLPTLRSRCRRLDLAPLSTEAIGRALAEHRPDDDPAERQAAATLSGGSLRRAILMLQGEGLGVYRRFQALAADLPMVDFVAVHDLAEEIAGRGAEDAYRSFLDGVEDWLVRRARRLPEPGAVGLSAATLAAPLASWASVWDKVALSARQTDELNLDRRQVVLQVFMTLANATRM